MQKTLDEIIGENQSVATKTEHRTILHIFHDSRYNWCPI